MKNKRRDTWVQLAYTVVGCSWMFAACYSADVANHTAYAVLSGTFFLMSELRS